jgi:hypothetical protein
LAKDGITMKSHSIELVQLIHYSEIEIES